MKNVLKGTELYFGISIILFIIIGPVLGYIYLSSVILGLGILIIAISSYRKVNKIFHWFLNLYSITSFVLFFSNMLLGNIALAGITFGQLFLILGIWTSTYNAFGYEMIVVGCLVFIISLINGYIPSIIIPEKVYVVLFGLAFIIIPSYTFIFAGMLNKKIITSKKGIKVTATCIDYDYTNSSNEYGSSKMYTAIYEFELNGQKYHTKSNIYHGKNLLPEKGETKMIIVNPKKLEQTYVPESSAVSKWIFIACGFFALLGLLVILTIFDGISREYIAYAIVVLELIFILIVLLYRPKK